LTIFSITDDGISLDFSAAISLSQHSKTSFSFNLVFSQHTRLELLQITPGLPKFPQNADRNVKGKNVGCVKLISNLCNNLPTEEYVSWFYISLDTK